MRVLQTLALPLGHVTIFGVNISTPFGAADEARTRYLHLGKVALYQMSYGRILVQFTLHLSKDDPDRLDDDPSVTGLVPLTN